MSKLCSKCNKIYNENTTFCPSCGTRLENQEQKFIDLDDNEDSIELSKTDDIPTSSTLPARTTFGNQPQVVSPNHDNLLQQPLGDSNNSSETQTFTFEHSPDSGAGTTTKIIACGNELDISRHSYYLFIKYGKKHDVVNINNITSIITERRLPFFNIVKLLVCVLATLAFLKSSVIFGLIGFAICIFMLMHIKDNYLIIFHKHGMVRIRESRGGKEETESFLNYVRARNPDAIKVVI